MEYVLAIGNSFSRDATAYLHDVCRSMGISAHVVNLYIGGCSLERHWSCVLNHEKAYQYQENGIITDRYVGVSDILHDKPWIISLPSRPAMTADGRIPMNRLPGCCLII